MENKLIFAVFGFCLIFLVVCGCTSQTSQAPVESIIENTTTPIITPTITSFTEYQVRVNYPLAWDGNVSIDYTDRLYPISGYGLKTFDIPSDVIPRNPFHYIVAEVFKGDLSKGPEITVEILQNGIVVNQNSSEGGIRHYSQIYPEGKPAIAGFLAGSWEEYNQNPDAIEELKAVYYKEPAWGNERVALRKQLGLPLDP